METQTLLLIGLGGLVIYLFTRKAKEAPTPTATTDDDDFWDISASDVLEIFV